MATLPLRGWDMGSASSGRDAKISSGGELSTGSALSVAAISGGGGTRPSDSLLQVQLSRRILPALKPRTAILVVLRTLRNDTLETMSPRFFALHHSSQKTSRSRRPIHTLGHPYTGKLSAAA